MNQDKSEAQTRGETEAACLEFYDSRTGSEPQHVFPISEREILKIGRDPRANTFVITTDSDCTVSRNHCEVYAVVYEPTINHIYVRDRKSFNGTFVNGECVGSGPEISCGFLLQNGDVIEIKPYWSFVLRQAPKPTQHRLTDLQVEECKRFSDKYAVTERCLGQGAEGSVHLAIEVSTKKQLVCKLVNLDKLQGRQIREGVRRTFQEADILRQLSHPNILPYIDAVSSPHSLYIFTELASGGDLMSFIYRHDSVKELDTRIIMRQALCGLDYLHSKGIVHRDLKPENILLAISPKIAYHRVMLSDFGTSAVPRRSRMMTIVGTMQYRAPEFHARTPAQTAAVDIWSLGVVALILLTAGSDIDTSDLRDLAQLNQVEIQSCLKHAFAKMSRQPSSNGKNFLWACLQVDASKRMSASEARCHEWLTTPEKYVNFFQQLDAKMLADWRPCSELRPMPLELPSILSNTPETCSGQHAQVPKEHPAASPQGNTNSSRYFHEQHSHGSKSVGVVGGEAPFAIQSSECDAVALVEVPSELSVTETPCKQMQAPWEGFLKPSQLMSQPPRVKKKKTARLGISEAALLPLTGLGKHLRPPLSDTGQRRQVLQELKKTNSKFLVDQIPLIPNSQQAVDVQASTPVKKRNEGTTDVENLSDAQKLTM